MGLTKYYNDAFQSMHWTEKVSATADYTINHYFQRKKKITDAQRRLVVYLNL